MSTSLHVTPARESLTAPLVAWVGNSQVGSATVFRNLIEPAAMDSRIRTLSWRLEVQRDDTFQRRVKVLPERISLRLRWLGETLPLFQRRDVEVLWTQYLTPLAPWLLTDRVWRRTPVVYSIDATLKQMHDFGPHYNYFGGRSPARYAARNRLERLLLQRMTLITPRSEWAARSMREDYGIPAERIRVVPPGVDLDFLRPSPTPPPGGRLPRAVFVGGDFERKGGDLLLDVFRHRFRGRLELDLVTRANIPEEPGVRLHSGLNANDPALLAVYQRADFMVLPTRAECFGVAAVEALACGLPVILGRVGGTPEVLEDGVQGYYVEPGDGEALGAALERLISQPSLRERMGKASRSLAERRYDRRHITSRLVGWLRELARPAG